MNTIPFSIGDHVVASYKSGEYIAEVLETAGPKVLLKVVAVYKHPTQGDLHHPQAVDVPLFHQRRALSEFEKVMVMPAHLRKYNGPIPSYKESLDRAIQVEKEKLQQMIAWAQASLEQFAQLEQDYFPNDVN